MNGVSSVKMFWWGLESPPRIENILTSVGYVQMERLVLSNPHLS